MGREGSYKHRAIETFRCRALCKQGGKWDMAQRGRLNCTLLDYQGEWAGELIKAGGTFSGVYLGRGEIDVPADRLLSVAPNGDSEKPSEDPSEGCPGGWYRSEFAYSVAQYARRRIEGGQRVPNLRLERCEDEFILTAAEYMEIQEDRAWARWMEAVDG